MAASITCGLLVSTTDVDYSCAFRNEFQGVIDCAGRIEPASAIRKRVGSDIDNTHDRGYRQIKSVNAAAKEHTRNR
jgi:hypothetical protein